MNPSEKIEIVERALQELVSGGAAESPGNCKYPCHDTDCNTCQVTCHIFSWNFCDIDLPF